MASGQITIVPMTQHDDDKAGDQYTNREETGDGPSDGSWEDFVKSHQDDLGSVASSGTARRFERKARRRERRESKKSQFDVKDLEGDSFVGGGGHGPRDFESSWLDVDRVMDQSSDFTPPNPDLSNLGHSRLLFIALTVLGAAGLLASLLIPSWGMLLGSIGAFCLLIGVTGLITGRKNFRDPSSGLFDDDRHFRR